MDLMDLMDLMDDFTFFESILSILSIWSTRRRGCFSTERAAAKNQYLQQLHFRKQNSEKCLSFLIGFENSQKVSADVKFPDGMSTLEDAIECGKKSG